MKKTMKTILVCALCLFLLCGCTAENKNNRRINELIFRFEAACQNADISGIADCIDPSLISPVKAIMSVFDVDFDLVDGVVDYALSDVSFMAEYSEYRDNRDQLMQILQSFKIKAIEYEYNESENRCTVRAILTVDYNGESESEECLLFCVLKNDEWYITFEW